MVSPVFLFTLSNLTVLSSGVCSPLLFALRRTGIPFRVCPERPCVSRLPSTSPLVHLCSALARLRFAYRSKRHPPPSQTLPSDPTVVRFRLKNLFFPASSLPANTPRSSVHTIVMLLSGVTPLTGCPSDEQPHRCPHPISSKPASPDKLDSISFFSQSSSHLFCEEVRFLGPVPTSYSCPTLARSPPPGPRDPQYTPKFPCASRTQAAGLGSPEGKRGPLP